MYPTNSLTITIEAITAKHLSCFNIQALKMIQPFLND